MYGIMEAIQPYMSYVWFPGNIYGGQPVSELEKFAATFFTYYLSSILTPQLTGSPIYAQFLKHRPWCMRTEYQHFRILVF